ncbi:MAG: hypothetical protein ACI4U5_04775 [Bacilli bacterium]
MIEFKFVINWASIFTFLFGICCGIVLLTLVYLLSTLKKIDKEAIIVGKEINKISSDEMKQIVEQDIKEAQNKFIELRKEENGISWETIKNVNLEMMNKIASHFYPESKQPLTELSIEELILLDRYIMDKLELILNKVKINMFKKLKLSTILKLLNLKQNVENNVVVKATKKYKLNKVVEVGHTILNALNPGTWFKKLVYNPAISIITKNICLLLISQIGQETYHIYSKQAFMPEYSDEELDNLIRLIHEQNLDQPTDDFLGEPTSEITREEINEIDALLNNKKVENKKKNKLNKKEKNKQLDE